LSEIVEQNFTVFILGSFYKTANFNDIDTRIFLILRSTCDA